MLYCDFCGGDGGGYTGGGGGYIATTGGYIVGDGGGSGSGARRAELQQLCLAKYREQVEKLVATEVHPATEPSSASLATPACTTPATSAA